MRLRSWLRSSLAIGGLVLATGEAAAQRGGGGPPGGYQPGMGGPPGGMQFQPGMGGPPGMGMGGPPGMGMGGPPGMGMMGGGMGRGGGSPEERWAMFAGNSDSIDLKDPKNAMVAGMIARRYQIPPDGILRKSSYLEQAAKMGPPSGMGGPPGMMGGPPSMGAPQGEVKSFTIVSPGSENGSPGMGGPPGMMGGPGMMSRGGPGMGRGDRGAGGPGGGEQQQQQDNRQQDNRQSGDPIEDPRPFVVRYGNLPKDAPPFWNEADKDRDGQISLYEWRTYGKDINEFMTHDLNNDGFLTVEEHSRALQQIAEERESGRKPDSRGNGRGMMGGRGTGMGGPGSYGPGTGGPGMYGPGARPSTGESQNKGEQPREERGGKNSKSEKGDKGDKGYFRGKGGN